MPDVDRVIEQAKQELEHMIDLNPQVMLLVDRSGTVARANSATLRLLGRPDFRDVIGKRFVGLFPGCDEVAAMFHGERCSTVHEAAVQLPEQQEKTLRFTVVSGGRNTEVCVVIVHDITGEKEQAVRLEMKHKKEAVNALAGALMHNINQSLTVIMVRSQLMQLSLERHNARPDDLQRSLQDIVGHTQRIAEIIESAEKPKTFVTQAYIGDVRIMDLEKSSDAGARNATRTPDSLLVDQLIAALEVHDAAAAAHSRRTGAYARVLARSMALPEAELRAIERAALVHDIGKLGIPQELLQKPVLLSADEMVIMKQHSLMGRDLLHAFGLPDKCAEVAYSHHEHHDGSGYPRGLAGSAISSVAAIVAVVDTFDAMRSERSYQKPASLDDIVRTVSEAAGTQFDPAVVEAFGNHYRELDGLRVE